MAKEQTSVRMSAEGKRILKALAKQYGLSQGSVLEMAVRAMPNVGLSPEAKAMLSALAKRLSISQGAVIELAVRGMANKGIT